MATTADPRKPQTGTTYTSEGQGIVSPDPGALQELGINSNLGLPDVVPTLRGSRALRKWQEMADNDATINASLLAIKLPVIGAEFFIEPSGDSQLELDVAEFVGHNLFEGQSVPWIQFLDEVLTKYETGFAVHEAVYEQREWSPMRTAANMKVYYMLKKLAFRPQTTIQAFLYDDQGGPAGVTHLLQSPTGKSGGGNDTVDIPIEKLLIFTNKKRGGDLMGKSVLRTAYKHWYYKEGLYKIDAIQKERHGIGVPDIELPPGHSPADEAKANEMGENLRTNEFARIVRPFGWNIGFAELSGNLVNVLDSIQHHDLQIAKNVLAQFINDSGGRSTAGTQMDLLMKALRHEAERICEALNLYIVPQLVSWNFAKAKFPKVRVRSIGETRDLQAWSSAIANLAGAKMLTPTIELEHWIRKTLDAPHAEIHATGFQQAFTVPATPVPQNATRQNETPNQLSRGQAQNTPDSKPTPSGSGQTQTGNVPKPVNAS